MNEILLLFTHSHCSKPVFCFLWKTRKIALFHKTTVHIFHYGQIGPYNY